MFTNIRVVFLGAIVAFVACIPAAWSQSTSTIRGTVTDSSGAVVPNAKVTIHNQATSEERITQTDNSGNYVAPSLPVGTYRITAQAPGMQTAVASNLVLEVARTVEQDFKLKVADVSQTIEINAAAQVIEGTTVGVGQVVNQNTVQQIPLNGRHFVDMGLLVAGSVTPPQTGNLTAPLRGQGSFSFNTAGNREDTVNFMINGINLNDMVQNQITFQPSINTVSEFKVDNQTYSAEYGRNSGAIVNIATRSGTNAMHGEVFEFVRNHAFDARNFFNRETSPSTGLHQRQSTFKRNNFGAALGGPIWKDRTFYFISYEGLRQRQGVDTSAGVLTAAQRAAVTDPAIQQLLQFIPLGNSGTATAPLFVSSALAPVNIDQGTADISHSFNSNDRLHGYYAIQQDLRQEPILQGNNIPGFGDTRQSRRQIFTLNETHVISPNWVNEARLGFNRIFITFQPNVQLNPATFGISNGVTTAIGLPQIQVNGLPGTGLNFGGPSGFPQGRGDLTAVFSDTVSWLHGNHSIKLGGEFRRFNGNSFTGDTSRFTFNNITNLETGKASVFVVTPGNRPSRIQQNALGFFITDNYKVLPYFTLDLGLRLDWNMSPTEARNRFVNFDPTTDSLVQVGHEVGDVYNQNVYAEPRVGFAWDLFHDGKTVLRAAYGYNVDQPTSNVVTGLASNPPFANPINFQGTTTNTVPITSAFTAVTASNTVSPNAVNHNLKNAYVQEWNLNVQQQVTPTVGIMVGYFGSKGTHLRLLRNLNQIEFPASTTLRPFTTLVGSQSVPCSFFSAISCPKVGNITTVDDAGNSNYNALWASATKRISHGLEFSASYTWSKSLDYNSIGSQQGAIPFEDSNNPRLNYGPSDFDVRHRFVLSGLYDLPFHGNRFIEGWEFASIAQFQTGNPVNIVIPDALNGVANTIRPDQLGTINIVDHINADGSLRWFTNNGNQTICGGNIATPIPVTPNCLLFIQSNHFGSMKRNALLGPGFQNVDLSLIKTTKITERLTNELRVEFFNIFNHPNFGQPNTVGANEVLTPGQANFGVITSTRFPTGDSGSARQIQFAVKFKF